MGLFDMMDLGNVFCRLRELKRTPSMMVGREASALDHGYRVRHVGGRRITKPIAEHGTPGTDMAEWRQ